MSLVFSLLGDTSLLPLASIHHVEGGEGNRSVLYPVSLGPSAPTADSQHGIQATARAYRVLRNQEALVAALSLASVGICLGYGSSDVNHSHDELGFHSSGQCRLSSSPSQDTVFLLCWAMLGGEGGMLQEEDSSAEKLESCWDDCCAGAAGAEPWELCFPGCLCRMTLDLSLGPSQISSH